MWYLLVLVLAARTAVRGASGQSTVKVGFWCAQYPRLHMTVSVPRVFACRACVRIRLAIGSV